MFIVPDVDNKIIDISNKNTGKWTLIMNYSEKLKTIRSRQSSIKGRCFNEEMESDRGRAINSAAVRRLQQKTQVFPLETNAAVRSRLTHSLEVQQVGRYISKTVLKKPKTLMASLAPLKLLVYFMISVIQHLGTLVKKPLIYGEIKPLQKSSKQTFQMNLIIISW